MPSTEAARVNGACAPDIDIIDIRTKLVEFNIKDDIIAMINPLNGPRSLPTMLLYNETGLKLFEKITYLEEYYLTNNEIDLLNQHSTAIASRIPSGSLVVELGSGNLRKVCILLQALEDAGKPVDYYALDLSQRELERTLSQAPSFRHVRCHGLLGTYDDGKDWLEMQANSGRHISLVHLGSSIGNFSRPEAAEFLQSFSKLMKPSDIMIIGLDSTCDADKVYHAYNDREGVTHQFILNGLAHANEILGDNVFDIPDWRVIGEYVYDEEGGRHQAFLSPTKDTIVHGNTIKANERVKIEQSLKYSNLGAKNLWKTAGLIEADKWGQENEYGLHMLRLTKLPISLRPNEYASKPLPTLNDWYSLWEAWDAVTQNMLPREELQNRPIKLRNASIFYLGHIPTFLDIQLHKTTKLPPTEPAFYYKIFERGIDPDVDNPEKCHDHSDVPEEWPAVEDILGYQGRVRQRLIGLYASGQDQIPRGIGRAIWVGFEHEVMHLETLLYMMIQSDNILPPPNRDIPDFSALAEEAKSLRVDNQWFDIPEQTVTLGMNDPEKDESFTGYFGWDNEKPERKVKVHSFQAQGRAITNEEYAKYLINSDISSLPGSWFTSNMGIKTNGGPDTSSKDPSMVAFLDDKAVRTIYGPVPLKHALDWPVFASYDELLGCAMWMGGRIPTMEEARSIYSYAEHRKERFTRSKLSNIVPAVNSHLVNDGVEETPPQPHSSAQVGNGHHSSSTDEQLFVDLSGTNTGFTNWHPEPITGLGGSLAGHAGMGGVWEWTSSPLTKHQGFEAMELYPAYTSDFFDNKHNIVLGGSWATHSRVAGRKSFVNWYQRNYPYAWAGARLVRDI